MLLLPEFSTLLFYILVPVHSQPSQVGSLGMAFPSEVVENEGPLLFLTLIILGSRRRNRENPNTSPTQMQVLEKEYLHIFY